MYVGGAHAHDGDGVVPRHRDEEGPAVGTEGEGVGIAPHRCLGIERDGELLAYPMRREVDPRDAVHSRQCGEQFATVERERGRVGADEEGGRLDRWKAGQIELRDGRIAPIAHIEVAPRGVGNHGVGVMADGNRGPASQGRRVDQVERVTEVPDRRNEPVSRDHRDARDEQLRRRVGEAHGVPRPRRVAAHEAIDGVRPTAARPHGVVPGWARRREADPCAALRQRPGGASGGGIDPAHAVRTVAVRSDGELPVRQHDETQRHRADRYLAAGGIDSPPGGQLHHRVGVGRGCGAAGRERTRGHRENGERFAHTLEYRQP